MPDAKRPEARPVSRSRTTLTELMVPSYANFGGKIHGGILLGLMDKVAYACASKHAGHYCVTVSVQGVDFRAPVDVGDLVSLRGSVNHVGVTSLLVGIRVEAENVSTGEVRHTNTSYFTMVAKGPDGRPARVPPLLLETRDDVRRYLEAIERRALEAEYARAFERAKSHIPIDAEHVLRNGHRCELAPGLDLRDEGGE
ncbi:MAG: acyl-CoA thioesterase [Sandaracinaceae bacterium]